LGLKLFSNVDSPSCDFNHMVITRTYLKIRNKLNNFSSDKLLWNVIILNGQTISKFEKSCLKNFHNMSLFLSFSAWFWRCIPAVDHRLKITAQWPWQWHARSEKRQNQRQMQFAVMPTLDQVPGTAHQLIAPASLVFGLVWFWLWFQFGMGSARPGAFCRWVFSGFRWVLSTVRESWAVGRCGELLARCSNYGRASKGNRKCCTSWLDKPLKEGRLTAPTAQPWGHAVYLNHTDLRSDPAQLSRIYGFT